MGSRVVEDAKQYSDGMVEHHLVGAILERRFRGIEIPNYPAHTGSRSASRAGDFEISNLVYHVTTTPIQSTFQKCAENIRAGLHPILLVTEERENKALRLAQDEGIDKRISVVPIEAFITLNIVHLAIDEDKDFFDMLKEIVEIYNGRLAAVESDADFVTHGLLEDLALPLLHDRLPSAYEARWFVVS